MKWAWRDSEAPSIAPVSQRGRKGSRCRGRRAERGQEGMKETHLGSY